MATATATPMPTPRPAVNLPLESCLCTPVAAVGTGLLRPVSSEGNVVGILEMNVEISKGFVDAAGASVPAIPSVLPEEKRLIVVESPVIAVLGGSMGRTVAAVATARGKTREGVWQQLALSVS